MGTLAVGVLQQPPECQVVRQPGIGHAAHRKRLVWICAEQIGDVGGVQMSIIPIQHAASLRCAHWRPRRCPIEMQHRVVPILDQLVVCPAPFQEHLGRLEPRQLAVQGIEQGRMDEQLLFPFHAGGHAREQLAAGPPIRWGIFMSHRWEVAGAGKFDRAGQRGLKRQAPQAADQDSSAFGHQGNQPLQHA